jgi:hypothetical protein
MPPEQKQAIVMELAQDPAMQQQALEDGKPKMRNAVAQMDVDIIIDRTMDTVTIQQEQFAGLLDIAKVRPEVPFDVLIEASQLRSDTKKRVLDRLKGSDDPMAQQMAQLQARMAELDAALKEMDLVKAQAQAAKDQAAAEETKVDSAVKVAQFITQPAQPKTQVSVN